MIDAVRIPFEFAMTADANVHVKMILFARRMVKGVLSRLLETCARVFLSSNQRGMVLLVPS